MKKTPALVGILALQLCAQAAPKEFTRAELLKGCKIPERRPMPLSSKVKPCEDFHKYVCGEVEKSFKLPAERSLWIFSFVDNNERILCAKKRYFELLSQGYVPKSPRLKPAQAHYEACMNVKAAVKDERDTFTREMAQLAALKTREELLELFQQRIEAAIPGVLAYVQLPNQSNPLQHDVLFVPGMRVLPERSYIDNAALMKELEGLARDFFQAAGWNEAAKRARWVLGYERGMQKVFPLPVEIRERVASNTYKDRDFFLSSKNLRLERFLKLIPEKVAVRNVAPESLAYLDQWLGSEEVEAIKSVYAFYTYHTLLDDAYPAFYKRYWNLAHKFFGGPAKRDPRQERCTKYVMSSYGMELDEELIAILFPDFPSERVKELSARVRRSLLQGLDDNTWLSRAAKNEAKSKMAGAAMYLVKPEREEDWLFLPELQLSSQTPTQNFLALRKATHDRKMREFATGRSRTQWDMSPLTLNAFYTPADNKFVLLQGILQYPFFAADYSDIENLAAIGTVIGHELGHGIDDKGSRYDSEGRLRRWMSEQDLAEFRARGSKFVERFARTGHNGVFTLGENIGDHVGLTFSYAAAFPEGKASVEEQKRYFEAYARLWCGVVRPTYEKTQLKTDPHALNYARINQQVIDHPAFYEAYGCKAGDKMYLKPEDRIRVW